MSALKIPVGTQVVVRRSGRVGVVADAGDSYLVRFADGGEDRFDRASLLLFRRQQEEWFGGLRAGTDWWQYIALRCVVGSKAFGLDRDSSDTDRRGFFLAPADLHWSLAGVPEQIEREGTQECYWEFGKFVRLALRANPNVLECLYTPMIETATPIADELIAMRDAFLSKLIHQTYDGYVISQFKKIEQDQRTHGEIRWKHAMHLLRLLISGISVLKHGFLTVDMREHRDLLLAVRDGALSWEEADALRRRLHREFDEARSVTRLPDLPDFSRVDDFVIRARRSMVR